MSTDTLTLTETEVARATELRRALHRIPELGYEEFKTAEVIRAELTRLGVPFVPGPASAPTATIAVIGDPAQPCLALRADIDALPIEEASGVSWVSTHDGRMHACGHDGHAANLLGTAAALTRLNLKNVCVKLIFQPAEEGGGGAGRLVEAGVLDGGNVYGPKVLGIFGLHGWPGLPVGMVSTKGGPLMAAVDRIAVTVRGRGCHGAFPHLGTDPILAAANSVVSLQAIVSREVDPTDAAVVTVGIFQGGTATNIIPDTATYEATVRSLSDTTRQKLKASLYRQCAAVAQAHGCTAEIEWEDGYPATINDGPMAELVSKVAREKLGQQSFYPAPSPVMGGEDFAYYLEKVPGAFFFVGVKPPDVAEYPTLHSDRFDFTDSAMEVGTKMYLGLVQAWAAGRAHR
jgi:amidohydrolase